MPKRTQKPVACDVAGMWCYEPKNCGECAYFIENTGLTRWVCSACIRPDDKPSPYYQEGVCDRCDKHSAILIVIL